MPSWPIQVLLLFVLVGCAEAAEDAEPAARAPGDAQPADDRQTELMAATRHFVDVLRGREALQPRLAAERVMVYRAPEGGGDSVAIARESLADPQAWAIESRGVRHSLVPVVTMGTLTTKTGTHFRCREYPLASIFPDLARFPHVGARLEPLESESCLNTWNATFVFDTTAAPRLIAVIYDQWEW